MAHRCAAHRNHDLLVELLQHRAVPGFDDRQHIRSKAVDDPRCCRGIAAA